IDEVGEVQSNGRWLYHPEDLVVLHAFDFASKLVGGNKGIFQVAAAITKALFAQSKMVLRVRDENAFERAHELSPRYIFACRPYPALPIPEEQQGWMVIKVRELGDLPDSVPGGLFFDLWETSRKLPEALVAVIADQPEG
ncbi:MAG: hypothetical protein AAGA95_21625, partial [Pseudomonadota bacterium]